MDLMYAYLHMVKPDLVKHLQFKEANPTQASCPDQLKKYLAS